MRSARQVSGRQSPARHPRTCCGDPRWRGQARRQRRRRGGSPRQARWWRGWGV